MKQRKWKLKPTTKAELNGLFPGYISFPIFFSFTYYIPVLKWNKKTAHLENLVLLL